MLPLPFAAKTLSFLAVLQTDGADWSYFPRDNIAINLDHTLIHSRCGNAPSVLRAGQNAVVLLVSTQAVDGIFCWALPLF